MVIDTKLKELREDNDIKQQEIAGYLNITQATYSDYENGKINIPIEIYIKLAQYYNTSVDYLIKNTREKKAYPKY